MFETRRCAETFGFDRNGACRLPNWRQYTLLGIQPVNLAYQPDILINVDEANNVGSWVYLQYSGTQYYAFKNKSELPLSLPGPSNKVLPDLNVVSSDTYWEPFTGSSISISNSSATLTLQQGSSGSPSTTSAQLISAFANDPGSETCVADWVERDRQAVKCSYFVLDTALERYRTFSFEGQRTMGCWLNDIAAAMGVVIFMVCSFALSGIAQAAFS